MADAYSDQASGLRRLFGAVPVQICTFVAGGEGVGKTLCVANLAATFARQGREVLVFDENVKGNVAAYYGAQAGHDLYHVIARQCRLADILVEPVPGVRILPAASAVMKLGKLKMAEQETLLSALVSMERKPDIILVDASTEHPLGFSPLGLATQETVVVVTPDRAAITAAYALIKKVSLGYSRRNFRILFNKGKQPAEAHSVFGNLAAVASQKGVARLDYAGQIPLDECLAHAGRLARTVHAVYPESPAAAAFRLLAADMMHWPPSSVETEGIEHFVQQLLHLSRRIDPVPIHAR